MDVKQFIAEFGHIASAPGGVTRLRQLVYALASEGTLLPDSELVELTHLDKVADFVMGQAPPGDQCNTNGDGTVFVKTGEFGELYPVVREWTTKPLKIAKKGDVLICVVGATVGKLNLAIECAIGRSVAAIRPRGPLEAKYLYFMLMPFTLRLRSGSRGSAQGVIGKAELAAIKLRVPSEDEQKRIVTKVDELTAMCDKLESQQRDRRKLQSDIRQATLQAVASASSSHEVRTAWARLEANFGSMFSAPEDVRLLRDVIFDLALRGALIPEPARPESTTFAGDERLPLPVGWAWSTLADLSEYITSGSRGWKSYTATIGDAFIRSQDIKHDALIFENPAFVSLPSKVEGKRTLVQSGDVLLTITGGNVGKCATIGELNGDAYVSQHVALIRLRDKDLSRFVHFWMVNSFGGRGFLSRYIYGDKPGLNLTQVGSVPVPIPPKHLLQSILGILETYRDSCDRLSEQLGASAKVATALAISAVSTLTGIRIKYEEEETVKAPQTELISPLRIGTPPDIKVQAPLASLLSRHNGEMSARDLWQRFGGEVDAFYAQLKTEVAHGWVLEPAVAEMREKSSEPAGA